ncbi:MAG: BrnT family toxin, partial [Chitinispirillaceae bacterium]|nr:BrnT family toxin [Chitinispirillaceae bacterium]
IYMIHQFEFDAKKSDGNKQKHGIDFIEIQEVWEDTDRMEIPARTKDETRFLIIGKVKSTLWSVIITYRENKIRIISARRSREKEVTLYES